MERWRAAACLLPPSLTVYRGWFVSRFAGGGDPEGTVNAMLALIAAEQKARAHIQRKLMSLSELQRTLEAARNALLLPPPLAW